MIASVDELIRGLEEINDRQYKEIVELRKVIAKQTEAITNLTAQLIEAHDQLEEEGVLDEKNKTVESV